MPFVFRDLEQDAGAEQEALKRQFKEKRPPMPVVLCDADGRYVDDDGNPISAVTTSNANYVYAREWGESTPKPYLNRRGIDPVGGTPCFAGYAEDSTEAEILGTFLIDPPATRRISSHNHAREHEPGGYQPVNVYPRMLTPLRVTPLTGLVVQVAPLVYDRAGTLAIFPGTNLLDLTASLPAAGLARWVLIYLDPANNTVNTVAGDTAPDSLVFTPPLPAPPSGTYPSAWVRLAGGQSEISEINDIYDSRLILARFGGGSGYPFAIITVDPGGLANYTTITEAVAAAPVGAVIKLGPHTYSEEVVLFKSVTLLGHESGRTILTSTAITIDITTSAVTLMNLRIQSTGDGAVANCVRTNSGNLIFRNCLIEKLTGDATDASGLHAIGGGDLNPIDLIDTIIRVENGTNRACIRADTAESLVNVYQGELYTPTGDAVLTNVSGTVVNLLGTFVRAGDITQSAGVVLGRYTAFDGTEHLLEQGLIMHSGAYLEMQKSTPNPVTPAAGNLLLYADTDGYFYQVDELDERIRLVQDVIGANLLAHSLTYANWPGGVTFNDITDGRYVAALWCVIHNATTPDVAMESSSGGQASAGLRITFDAANSQAGVLYFIDNARTQALRGKPLSLSAELLSSDATKDIRAGLLSWTSSGNQFTKDAVGTWGAGDPTLATNWEYVNVAADIGITDEVERYVLFENVIVPNDANNIAIFIWTPDLEPSADWIQIQAVKWEVGEKCTEYIPVSREVEDDEISWHYEAITQGAVTNKAYGLGYASTTSNTEMSVFYSRKRKPPAISFSNVSHFLLHYGSSANANVSSFNIFSLGEDGQAWGFAAATTTPFSVGHFVSLIGNSSSAMMEVDARLPD